MKKTLLTIAATAGIALGGMSAASVASAQSYGDDSSTETPPSSKTSTRPRSGHREALPVQEENDGPTEDAEPNEDAQANEDGERAVTVAVAAGTSMRQRRRSASRTMNSGRLSTRASRSPMWRPPMTSTPTPSSTPWSPRPAEHLAEKVEAGRLTQDRGRRAPGREDRAHQRPGLRHRDRGRGRRDGLTHRPPPPSPLRVASRRPGVWSFPGSSGASIRSPRKSHDRTVATPTADPHRRGRHRDPHGARADPRLRGLRHPQRRRRSGRPRSRSRITRPT